MDKASRPVDPFQESWDIQAAASALGFDWPNVEGVLAKMEEEIEEIRDALRKGDREHAAKELGDLLLAAVNTARFLDTDPGEQLQAATKRFSTRFAMVKNHFEALGKAMESCPLDELENAWQAAKTSIDQGLEKRA